MKRTKQPSFPPPELQPAGPGTIDVTQTINVRARPAQIEYWRTAARLAGYGERGLSAWIKAVLSREANAVYLQKDRGRPEDEDDEDPLGAL